MTRNSPNLIFVLLDDVGWNDIGYNSDTSPIPTPYIDSLARGPNAVQFSQYYVNSLCSPTRASLLTGRYSINAGIPYVIVPGSPLGLNLEAETLAMALKSRAGYRAAMSGKWHLGHSQKQQTPVGRGFDEFTGLYMWDADSYTKQFYAEPWNPLMIDWVQEYSNGTYYHYAEPRHSTEAITAKAEEMMIQHAAEFGKKPLFLYVAYTAAHSPLQPLERHLNQCLHITHLWRRQFCGMVVGVDEGMKNLTRTAIETLGKDTIFVVTSDNGGSPWWGGMSQPYRGGKLTPYEGGVKVPALIVDFSEDTKFLKKPKGVLLERKAQFLMHASDWLPTLLSFAGVPKSNFPSALDGMDMAEAIRGTSLDSGVSAEGPRSEMLLELLTADDAMFGEDLFAYREGDWKLVHGYPMDPVYYSESSLDRLNSSSTSLVARAGEQLIRGMEALSSEAAFDTARIVITFQIYPLLAEYSEPATKLFNISADPQERTNLAAANPDVVARLMAKIEGIKNRRPSKPQYKLQFHNEKVWPKTFVAGDCSMNPDIAPKNCRFTHPWIENDVDPWAQPGLVDSRQYMQQKLAIVQRQVVVANIVIVLVTLLIWYFFKNNKKN